MNVYEKIIQMLNGAHADYVEKTHPAQGDGNEVAKIHGASLKQGAKAIVLKIKPSGYCLAVFPAAARLDAKRAKQVLKAKNVSFASIEETRQLTTCEIGAVPPFSFNENLPVVIDPSLLENERIFFNIGSLENSVTLNVNDYIKLVPQAQIASIILN